MIIDYYAVRKGYLQARDLYSADVNGPYYGHFGIQWRGYVAYICGILINVVGFAGACGVSVPIGATYIYRLNFFTGSLASGGVYYILCRIAPVQAQNPVGSWLEAPEPDEEDLRNVVSHGKEVEYATGLDVEQGGFFRKKMDAITKAL
jgi:NCS1 family nucleobase:cation symporter-1